jgi:hypothetical protein
MAAMVTVKVRAARAQRDGMHVMSQWGVLGCCSLRIEEDIIKITIDWRRTLPHRDLQVVPIQSLDIVSEIPWPRARQWRDDEGRTSVCKRAANQPALSHVVAFRSVCVFLFCNVTKKGIYISAARSIGSRHVRGLCLHQDASHTCHGAAEGSGADSQQCASADSLAVTSARGTTQHSQRQHTERVRQTQAPHCSAANTSQASCCPHAPVQQ